MRTARALALLLAIALSGPSCSWFRRKPKTPPPPAPPPPVSAKPAAEPPQIPAPPPIEPSASATPPPTTVIPPSPPVAKPPQEKKAVATRPPVRTNPPATVEAPPAESHPPATPPQLVQILTPAEQRFYSTKVDESLRRARRNLDAAVRRKLTASQQGMAERIRVFLAQADEARARDLVTAHSLATRADVLAQELAKGAR